MKLEVGQFVRFKDKRGIEYIRKIVEIPEDNRYASLYLDKKANYSKGLSVKNGIKASYNIIDLIKSKDIILGKDGKIYQCWKIYKDYVFTYSKNKYGQTITLVDYQIDRVLTREQFESMSYRIEE